VIAANQCCGFIDFQPRVTKLRVRRASSQSPGSFKGISPKHCT